METNETTNSQSDNQTQNTAGSSTSQKIENSNNKTLMGILAYLGPLVIIPYMISQRRTVCEVSY